MGNGSVPLITLKIKIMPSKAVLDRAEDVYQAMKTNRKNIVKRYGKEAENVMRGRAMNTAKNQVKTMNENRLKEIIKKKLSTNPKEIEEGKTGRVLGGLALFAALMAGNRALLDAEPRMAKLKTAYEQAEKAGDTARMKKIEDAITKQEIYLSTGQGEEQSIDEKKGKDLNNDNKIDSKDYLLARKAAIEKAKKSVKEDHGCMSCDSPEMDYEGEMAKSELYKLIQSAEKLFMMLDEDTQLEAWVQSKITKATDYLNSVEQYLEYQSLTHHSPNIEEEKLVYYLDK
jgi:hypothetical protein